MRIGAHYLGNERCEFVVWSPLSNSVKLKLVAAEEKIIPLTRDSQGYWRTTVSGVAAGALYFYKLNESDERPDPASGFQPQGVHGPSQVVDHTAFRWRDERWVGIPLESMIIYELHVGTFTPESTFDAVIARLGELQQTGINAIEIMPVAQFPGERNWGYDGAFPFAAQNSYGGPDGLKRLVNACHRAGISVILDVVYNHLGPEGNYLGCYGPYFTEKYKTPWGNAINFDDAHSAEVRNYFVENALYWLRSFHVDALRLDAVHAIYDMSARHILQELSDEVSRYSAQQGRKFYLIAESDLNDVRVTRPKALGGYELDAQWSDDFHHSLRTMLTGENGGYYEDFGKIAHLAKAFSEGFVYSGQYSQHRKRNHGSCSREIPGRQLLVFSQNHDQVGNRMLGERLSSLVSFDALKLAAGAVILSPYVPMLFMGEEYAETSPFLYFVSHSDPDLIAAVRRGRREEFESFKWQGEPPDPQSVETFLQSKLKWEDRNIGEHKLLLEFYRQLIHFRRNIQAIASLNKDDLEVSTIGDETLLARRWHKESHVFYVMNFAKSDVAFQAAVPQGTWKKILDSADHAWRGPGSSLPERIEQGQQVAVRPLSIVLFELEQNAITGIIT
jgi:maltooligosyltrehalose trehalohydrolase